MRVKFSLQSDKNISLQTGYSYQIQSFIYDLLKKTPLKNFHDTGFKYDVNQFKLFTFSNILEKAVFDRDKKLFKFKNKISFILSSPFDELLEQVTRTIFDKDSFYIGGNQLYLSSVEIIRVKQVKESSIKITTVTPIEIHKTYEDEFGKNKTYYFNPTDSEFSERVNDNIRKKWLAFYGKDSCPYSITISPIKKELLREKIQSFKGIVVKGWQGEFLLSGDSELISFALECGLGGRNSAGFGMIDIYSED
ncbi:CRISPR-associated endoribonuclease Cas6 [bacterium]|nr:CRISPR-associated endoribonuclease Cas6 [bacterium]